MHGMLYFVIINSVFLYLLRVFTAWSSELLMWGNVDSYLTWKRSTSGQRWSDFTSAISGFVISPTKIFYLLNLIIMYIMYLLICVKLTFSWNLLICLDSPKNFFLLKVQWSRLRLHDLTWFESTPKSNMFWLPTTKKKKNSLLLCPRMCPRMCSMCPRMCKNKQKQKKSTIGWKLQ